MAILRYGPWVGRLPYTDPKFQNYDAPTNLPSEFTPGVMPCNCAMTDWASGASWNSLALTYNDFDPVYYYDISEYFENPINTTISSTAAFSVAFCSLQFWYQATADFTVYFDYSLYAQLGFGYYDYSVVHVDGNGDELSDGDWVSLSGINNSGTVSFTAPASTMGRITVSVSNFGSDYYGDSCTLKIY